MAWVYIEIQCGKHPRRGSKVKHSLKIKMAGVAFLALMAVMVAVMVAVSLPRGEPALAQDAGICGRTLQVREPSSRR